MDEFLLQNGEAEVVWLRMKRSPSHETLAGLAPQCDASDTGYGRGTRVPAVRRDDPL